MINKQLIYYFLESVKKAEIELDNQKLLKKIVEISALAGTKTPIRLPARGLAKTDSVVTLK